MQGTVQFVDRVRAVIEQLTTTRGRLAVTATVLLATLVVAFVVVPFLIRQARRSLASRYMSGYVAETVEVVSEYVPTTMSGLAVRTVQASVALAAVFALLVVWGMFEVAVTVGVLLLGSVPYLGRALVMLVVVVAGFVLFDQLRQVISRFSDGTDHVTDHQEEIILRVGQVAVLVTVGASVLAIWGVDPSGLLVGAGFLGIVVGFAARQTLGSLIAGFVLMFSRPFTIGDWVEIGDDQGIVTDITIFNTRLENFDGEFVVLPNDKVTDSAVTNRSQKGLLRLRTDVGIDYECDPNHAKDVAESAIEDLDEVADTPPPQAIPKEFGDSAVVFELRYWIDHPTPPRRWAAVSAVVRRVRAAFDDAGITIPFPQRNLSARDGTPVDGTGPVGRPEATVDGEQENGQGTEPSIEDAGE